MRGGHSRSGPAPFDAETRSVRGSRTRPRHRRKGLAAVVGHVDPPDHLTAAEHDEWTYYATLLAAAGRLTRDGRDVLAKYCSVLATIRRLKAQMAAPEYRDVLLTATVDGAGHEHVTAKPHPLLLQLRQWVMAARSYETDLLLSPAAAMRAPTPPAAPDPEDVELNALVN